MCTDWFIWSLEEFLEAHQPHLRQPDTEYDVIYPENNLPLLDFSLESRAEFTVRQFFCELFKMRR